MIENSRHCRNGWGNNRHYCFGSMNEDIALWVYHNAHKLHHANTSAEEFSTYYINTLNILSTKCYPVSDSIKGFLKSKRCTDSAPVSLPPTMTAWHDWKKNQWNENKKSQRLLYVDIYVYIFNSYNFLLTSNKNKLYLYRLVVQINVLLIIIQLYLANIYNLQEQFISSRAHY